MKNELVVPNVSQVPIRISEWGNHEKSRLSHLHYHNEVELLVCRKGTISAVIDNTKYLLHSGDVLFFNSRVPHETFSEENNSQCMFLQFRIESFLQSPSDDLAKYLTYLRRNTTKTVQLINDPIIFNSLCAIREESTEKKVGYANLICANVHTICGMLARHGIFSDNAQADIGSLQKLLPALQFVEQNYSSELSLDEVSAAAGLNKFYFCRLFKKACGIGFSEYLNLVRVFKAEKMLKKTNKTVLEIAFDTGFSSVSYFNSIFKKYKGCTPTACRNAVNFNT